MSGQNRPFAPPRRHSPTYTHIHPHNRRGRRARSGGCSLPGSRDRAHAARFPPRLVTWGARLRSAAPASPSRAGAVAQHDATCAEELLAAKAHETKQPSPPAGEERAPHERACVCVAEGSGRRSDAPLPYAVLLLLVFTSARSLLRALLAPGRALRRPRTSYFVVKCRPVRWRRAAPRWSPARRATPPFSNSEGRTCPCTSCR